MKRVGFFYSPFFLEHDTGAGHPESSQRLKSILKGIEDHSLSSQLIRIDFFPNRAPKSLLPVHSAEYIEFVAKAVTEGAKVLDFGDTTVSDKSYEAALLAADAAAEAADQVWSGKLDRAFVAVRPPGHHAERDRAMGFCLFNNIAVAANHLLNSGAVRIAIIDWDVHHGNGTQNAFYREKRVLYISLHQFPHYPGSGLPSERGSGGGEGFNLNFPMRAGAGHDEYMAAFRGEILSSLNDFKPEIILVSAGFDAHEDDPLASIRLRTESYVEMTDLLLDVAERHGKGRLVSVLEGGYNLPILAECVSAHLNELLHYPEP